jgi:DNA-binding response OmpR family regulator
MTETKKRVLLVDDHPKLANVVRIALRLAGFEVTTASSGQEGLEFVRANHFDVMLLDIRMPDMNGFEVLREIRRFSRTPVIASSATLEYSTRALESGANAFLPKPFKIDQLTELINKLANDRE